MKKNNKNKRILLVNRGSSDNLGDQAIRFTLESLIESIDGEVTFSDFTQFDNNIYNYKSNKKKRNGRRLSIKRILIKVVPVSLLKRIVLIIRSSKTIKIVN